MFVHNLTCNAPPLKHLSVSCYHAICSVSCYDAIWSGTMRSDKGQRNRCWTAASGIKRCSSFSLLSLLLQTHQLATQLLWWWHFLYTISMPRLSYAAFTLIWLILVSCIRRTESRYFSLNGGVSDLNSAYYASGDFTHVYLMQLMNNDGMALQLGAKITLSLQLQVS